MILDCKNGIRGVLVDASAGRRIPFAIWADTDTGEYRAWKSDPTGRFILRGPDGKGIEVKGRTRLHFIPAKPVHKSKPGGTPLAEIRDEFRATGKAKPIIMVPGQECEAHGCHRLAEWRTGDEQVVEPEIGTDGKAYERAITTSGHLYCSWHYRAPVQTSLAGVANEVNVIARPN